MEFAQTMQLSAAVLVLQQFTPKNVPLVAVTHRATFDHSAGADLVVETVEHRHDEAIIQVAQETRVRQCLDRLRLDYS